MPASATRTPPHDDFELVRRVCSGDRSAASILFCDVLGPLLARLSDRWQYPDLSQDLYMRLSANDWAALRTWAGRASLAAWARTVAVREYLARTRRDRGSATVDLESIPSSDEPVVDRLVDKETWLGVEQAIERLENRDQRIVLRMHLLLSLAPHEIAARLDISVSHVYTHKARAVAKLRELLEVV